MFAVDWNLARYPGKTCCVQKCKRKGKREFDHMGASNCFWIVEGFLGADKI